MNEEVITHVAVLVSDEIRRFYHERGLRWPSNEWIALAWSQTEVAEAYEHLLAGVIGWARSRPDKHPTVFNSQDFGEELGDAILMLLVAGYIAGVDPLEQMLSKIKRTLEED